MVNIAIWAFWIHLFEKIDLEAWIKDDVNNFNNIKMLRPELIDRKNISFILIFFKIKTTIILIFLNLNLNWGYKLKQSKTQLLVGLAVNE